MLDGQGRLPFPVWLTGSGKYKFVLKNAAGTSTVWTADNVPVSVAVEDASATALGAPDAASPAARAPYAALYAASLQSRGITTVTLRDMLGDSYVPTNDTSGDASAVFNNCLATLTGVNVTITDPDGLTMLTKSPLRPRSGMRLLFGANTNIVKAWDSPSSSSTDALFARASFAIDTNDFLIEGGIWRTFEYSNSYRGRMFTFWGKNWQLHNLRIENYKASQGILFGGDNILFENVSVTTPDTDIGTGAFRMIGGSGFRARNCYGECGDDVFQFVPLLTSANNHGDESIADSYYVDCTGKSYSARLAIAGLLSGQTPLHNMSATIRRVGWIRVGGQGGNRTLLIENSEGDGSIANQIDDVLVEACWFDGSAESGSPVHSATIFTDVPQHTTPNIGIGTVTIRDTTFKHSSKSYGLWIDAKGGFVHLENVVLEGEIEAVHVEDGNLFIADGQFSTVANGGSGTANHVIVVNGSSPYLGVSGRPLISGVGLDASGKAAIRLNSSTAVADIEALRVLRAPGASGVAGLSLTPGALASLGSVSGSFDYFQTGGGESRTPQAARQIVRNASATLDAGWIGNINRSVSGTTLTFTIPVESSLGVPVGAYFLYANSTASAVTLAAASGVTLAGSASVAANAGVMVTKVAANSWAINAWVPELTL